ARSSWTIALSGDVPEDARGELWFPTLSARDPGRVGEPSRLLLPLDPPVVHEDPALLRARGEARLSAGRPAFRLEGNVGMFTLPPRFPPRGGELHAEGDGGERILLSFHLPLAAVRDEGVLRTGAVEVAWE